MIPRLSIVANSVLLVLALALTACAPQTGSPLNAPSSGAPAASQPNPLRIGASMSLTGQYARTGKEVMQAYELWRDQVNAKGGILGRQVQLVTYDDQSEPETAAKLYERLISEDKVDLIIGPYSTPVTIAASTVTEKYKYPMVVSGASGVDIWGRGYKYVFGMYTMAPFYMDGAVDLAVKNGLRSVALINENSAFSKDTMAAADRKSREAGLDVVYTEEYTKDVKDLSPTLIKIRALNPDVLMAGTYGEDATLIVRQLKDMGWAPKLVALTVGPALPDFVDTLKSDADFIFGATQWEPSVKSAGAPEFTQTYQAKYGYVPGYHAAGGFGAAQLLQQAIEKVGAVDNEKIRDALAGLETTTAFGAYKVDDKGSQTAKPSYLIQILNGERKIVWPDAAAESAATIPTPSWAGR
jgi:branched-chain amino acid transport system substrate-binding protein